MVNFKKATATATAEPTATVEATATIDPLDNEPDEFSSEDYRSDKVPSYPWLKVLNSARVHGVLVTFDQAMIAGWRDLNVYPMYEQALKNGEVDAGMHIQNPRMLVIRVGEQLRLNSARKVVGKWIKGDKERGFKPAQKALVFFLDQDNQPLHEIPFGWTIKGYMQYSFIDALERYRKEFETVWAKARGEVRTAKNQKFHSMVVFDWQSGAELKGSAQASNYACMVKSFTVPTVENYRSLFVGYDAEVKAAALEAFDDSEGWGIFRDREPEPGYEEDRLSSEYALDPVPAPAAVGILGQLKSLVQWTGTPPEVVRQICIDNGLPPSSVEFKTVDQVKTLRANLFLNWGNSQGVSSDQLYPYLDTLPANNTDAWISWQNIIRQKIATGTDGQWV